MSEKYILAIDIGGTFIKYAYVNQLFTIQEQWKKETKHFDSNDEFYDYLCEGIQVDNINCVGISAPGLIDYTSLVKTRAAKTVENMYGTTVNEEVGKRLNKFTATINDAKSAGLCELKIGNAQGTRSSGYLIIGTGVGGCLCNDKDVIYGNDGFAGEVHFIPYYDAETGKILKQNQSAKSRLNLLISKIKAAAIKREPATICRDRLSLRGFCAFFSAVSGETRFFAPSAPSSDGKSPCAVTFSSFAAEIFSLCFSDILFSLYFI